MEGLERELFSIAHTLGGISEILDSVDSRLSVVTDDKSVEVLQPNEIYLFGFEQFLKQDVLPKLVQAATTKLTFYVISATTMGPEDVPVLRDNYIFVRPRQWKLLKKTHERELSRWFQDRKEPFRTYWTEHTTFIDVLKIQKSDVQKDTITLFVEFKIRFSPSFYFGRHYCQAAIQFVTCEAGVEKCDVSYTSCETCKSRLVCKTHEEFEEKTICECKKE